MIDGVPEQRYRLQTEKKSNLGFVGLSPDYFQKSL